MTIQDSILAIEQAQELMRQANDLIKQAVRNRQCQQTADAYIISHLEILIDSNHRYFSSSTNLENIIEDLTEEQQYQEEE